MLLHHLHRVPPVLAVVHRPRPVVPSVGPRLRHHLHAGVPVHADGGEEECDGEGGDSPVVYDELKER